MSVIPYLSQGQGVQIDPLTGLPRKKKQAGGMSATSFRGGLGAFPGKAADNAAGGAYGQSRVAGSVTLPGFTPNYKSLIEQALGPLSAQLGAEGVADAASRDAALTRGIAQFGEPLTLDAARQTFGTGFVDEAGLAGLLPEANRLAAASTAAGLPFKARAQREMERALQQIQNQLAARGALRSGELGYQLQEQQNVFDSSQYDARQQLADYAAGLQAAFVQGQRGRASQLDAARREEAPRQAELNPATGSQEAAHAGFSPDGRPVYKRGDGVLVFEDGSVYTPAAPGPVAPASPADTRQERPVYQSPWANGYVDDVGDRNMQAMVEAIRRMMAV